MLQSWGHKELKMTKQLNNNSISITLRSTKSHVNLGAGGESQIFGPQRKCSQESSAASSSVAAASLVFGGSLFSLLLSRPLF